MVGALVSGSSGPDSSPGHWDIVLCSWARHLTLTVPLSLRWTGIPGSRNTPSRFMPQKPELGAGMMGHLVRMQTLPRVRYCLPNDFS